MSGPDDDLIRGPRWRTRTSGGRRGAAAAMTFAMIVGAGGVVVAAVMWVLDRLGAPGWLVVAPWAVPTVTTAAWVLWRPGPAIPTDDDDDSWSGYSVRRVLVGEGAPRPAPLRLAAALLFGAPVVWAMILVGLASLTGVL